MTEKTPFLFLFTENQLIVRFVSLTVYQNISYGITITITMAFRIDHLILGIQTFNLRGIV